MIYTLTLNPAIDQMISCQHFAFGVTNKAQDQYQVLGGKGINVSVMLKNLGHNNVSLGFMAQNDAASFETYLKEHKIKSYFHLVPGTVRQNLKIKDLSTNQETELNCLGFSVSKQDQIAIKSLIKHLLKKNDTLIIAGSIAPGTQSTIYHDIAQYCHQQQITFAIDTTKTNLLATLKYHPLVIKPNLAELNEIFNTNYSFQELPAVIKLGRKLLDQGALNVLISNGVQGSLLVTPDHSYLANTAQGKLINSVGAGDSMVAGFVGTYLATSNEQASLLVAVAAGASTAFSKGIGDLALIEKLKTQIKITQLE